MDQTNLANEPGIPATPMPGERIETEQTTKPTLGFVQQRLPWLVAAGAVLLYFLTLPRWVTVLGLPPLTRAMGWDWRPVLHAPLQFLVAYPCRWLPPSLQIFALNAFAAICGILTLALLARSVALLPHDRTRDQRQAERGDFGLLSIGMAWLPPLLAVLVCGLQLTFWENSVVWTGEMLDLLLFAYVVRCLLELRVDPRDSWLMRLGLAYGLGMTNNFALIAFLPALVIALVWIKGLSLFKFRSLGPMIFCGLAGLSLYLLLPILHSSSGQLETGFWEVFRLNLGYQKNEILGSRRVVVLLLSFTSVLPVLFMGIKWPASFGDISAAGNALTNLMTHVIHGVFLLACLYVAFDPTYSPRQLSRQSGSPHPFLSFYYLGALTIGYCSGYFLLVFGAGSARIRAWQRPSMLRKVINWAVISLVLAAAIGVPGGLLWKNLPQLRAETSRSLSQYASLATASLPAEGAIVLSDSSGYGYPYQLYAVCADLHQKRSDQKYILVESSSLVMPFYNRYLTRHYPKQWPDPPAKAKLLEPLDSYTQLRLLDQAGQSKPIYYLQPSFGIYFERFYAKPRHLAYELKVYPANTLTSPQLSVEELNENVQFWQRMKADQLKPLLQAVKPHRGKKVDRVSSMMGLHYSRLVDALGVELQVAGDLQRARECFSLALELNPESPSALLNLQYNQSLANGHPEVLKPSEDVEKRFAGFGGRLDFLLGWGGPVDEPGFRNDLAVILAKGMNFRQAGQQLLRVASLTPTNMDAQVGLAQMCLKAGLLELSLKYIDDVKMSGKKLHTGERETLLQTEAWAFIVRTNLPGAEKLLTEAQAEYPLSDIPYSTLAEIYLRMGRITNSMEVLEKELKAQPESGPALNNYARLKILNNELESAVKLLDHALTLDPKNSLVVLNRAISNLKLGRLDEAQRDYQTLETTLPQVPYNVYYGLFDVAFKKKNEKTALKYGELYLKSAPRGTPEHNDVLARMKKLKSGSA